MSDQNVVAEVMSLDTVRRHDDAAKKQLKGRYPKLDEAWEAIEKEFSHYHLPETVWHTCWEEIIADDVTSRVRLVVDRGGISVVKSWLEGEPDFMSRWHITKAPVELRVRLVKYVPALREAVIKSAEEFIPKVDEAIQTLNSFVAM